SFVWAKQFGGTQGGVGYAIDVDGSGNVYSTGTIGPTAIVDFDPGADTFYLTAPDPFLPEMYVSKLDASGNFVWANAMGIGEGSAIAVNAGGDVYSSGWYPISVTSVINKTSASGSIIWTKELG